MSIAAEHAKLTRSAKNLLVSWRRIQQTWRDENSRQFEEKYLSLLWAELRKTELAMERMNIVLNQLRRDCT